MPVDKGHNGNVARANAPMLPVIARGRNSIVGSQSDQSHLWGCGGKHHHEAIASSRDAQEDRRSKQRRLFMLPSTIRRELPIQQHLAQQVRDHRALLVVLQGLV